MSKPILERNIKIPNEILSELLTPSELRMIKNRWQILNLLEDGLSVRQVASQVKVGTDTVMRISRMMDKSSLQKTYVQFNKKNIKSMNPWIFGKSE